MTVFAAAKFVNTAVPLKKKERQNIQAVVRLRPPKSHEEQYIHCADRIGQQLVLGPQNDYTNQFTAVLGSASSQADAFKVCGMPLVEATLTGQSTCLFAYGQTGSGKTFR